MSLVAILIPTIDRIYYVERQLAFYREKKSKHPIYIGDSSEKKISIKLTNTSPILFALI